MWFNSPGGGLEQADELHPRYQRLPPQQHLGTSLSSPPADPRQTSNRRQRGPTAHTTSPALHTCSAESALAPRPGSSEEPRRFLQQLPGSLRHLGQDLKSSKGWVKRNPGESGLGSHSCMEKSRETKNHQLCGTGANISSLLPRLSAPSWLGQPPPHQEQTNNALPRNWRCFPAWRHSYRTRSTACSPQKQLSPKGV